MFENDIERVGLIGDLWLYLFFSVFLDDDIRISLASTGLLKNFQLVG